ncbi:MAG TPA: HAMP domain-containing sensor histidine kinase [Trichormus sp.]|jgi:signal transduction histidine kinase
MKLRYQGFVLIGVPLVFELTFVVILISLIATLEAAAAREAHAKLVISKCDQLRQIGSASYLSLFSMRLSGSLAMQQSYNNTITALKRTEIELRQLVQSDPPESKKLVDDYLGSVDHLLELLLEADGAYGKLSTRLGLTSPTFVQFISESEFFEEFTAFWHRQTNQAEKISAIYAPIVEEFQPSAARQRAMLYGVILAGVITNIVVAIVLAQVLARRTSLRLDRLMANIDSFAVGVLDLKPVGGNDEIAELDGKFRQIAEQRHASDELRRSILAMVSHDMRAPLTSLRGLLTLALDKVYGDPGAKLEKMLRRISSEALRLIRLSNDLLDTERINSGNFEIEKEEHFLESIADQAFNAVSGLAQTNEIAIRSDLPKEVMVPCDVDRIVQVLVNFLSNALKFSKKGDTVWLRAKSVQDGTRLRFEVTDQGPGIPCDSQTLVFERFKQLAHSTVERKEGSGLGLSICKALIEAHGGTIGVDSTVGRGSTFWFELPMSKA